VLIEREGLFNPRLGKAVVAEFVQIHRYKSLCPPARHCRAGTGQYIIHDNRRYTCRTFARYFRPRPAAIRRWGAEYDGRC
jgi:hypothetical protein